MPFQSQKLKGFCDIVICVDATGSMSPCIEALKSQIRTFIDGLEKPRDANTLPLNWRLKVVGFRDLIAGENFINIDGPMVKTASEAQAQVDLLEAGGGGDEPESALDALWHAAAKTEWRPTKEDPSPARRVVVLFSDASSHPSLHHDTVSAGAAGNDINAVRLALAENSVYAYVWAPESSAWTELALQNRFLVFTRLEDAGTGLASVDFSALLSHLGKTLSQSAAGFEGSGQTQPIA